MYSARSWLPRGNTRALPKTTIVERTTQARSRSSAFAYSSCRRTPRIESPRRKSRSSTGRRNASEFFCAVLSFVDIRELQFAFDEGHWPLLLHAARDAKYSVARLFRFTPWTFDVRRPPTQSRPKGGNLLCKKYCWSRLW